MKNKLPFLDAFKFTSLGYLPVGILMAFLSLAGIIPVNVNDKAFTGIVGFILMLVYIPLFGLTLSILFWVFYSFGFWINGKLRMKKSNDSEYN